MNKHDGLVQAFELFGYDLGKSLWKLRGWATDSVRDKAGLKDDGVQRHWSELREIKEVKEIQRVFKTLLESSEILRPLNNKWKHFSAFRLSKLRWWMDLKRDLERNQRVTFLILRMIVSPRVRSTGGNVSKICRYPRPVPTVSTAFRWELRYQTEFQQFVLTGSWNWPFPFLVDVTDPTFSFQSPGCITQRPLSPIQWIPKL